MSPRERFIVDWSQETESVTEACECIMMASTLVKDMTDEERKRFEYLCDNLLNGEDGT